MGRLSEAVEGSKTRRPQELVVPCVMHDRLRANPASVSLSDTSPIYRLMRGAPSPTISKGPH